MIKILLAVPQKWRIALSFCYLVIIVLLSLLPSNDLPDVHFFAFYDKLVHFSMYFGLTLLACWSFHAEKRLIQLLYILIFCISWGFLMELSQLVMMKGRTFEWNDELSNSVGSVLGALVYIWVAIKYRSNW